MAPIKTPFPKTTTRIAQRDRANPLTNPSNAADNAENMKRDKERINNDKSVIAQATKTNIAAQQPTQPTDTGAVQMAGNAPQAAKALPPADSAQGTKTASAAVPAEASNANALAQQVLDKINAPKLAAGGGSGFAIGAGAVDTGQTVGGAKNNGFATGAGAVSTGQTVEQTGTGKPINNKPRPSLGEGGGKRPDPNRREEADLEKLVEDAIIRLSTPDTIRQQEEEALIQQKAEESRADAQLRANAQMSARGLANSGAAAATQADIDRSAAEQLLESLLGNARVNRQEQNAKDRSAVEAAAALQSLQQSGKAFDVISQIVDENLAQADDLSTEQQKAVDQALGSDIPFAKGSDKDNPNTFIEKDLQGTTDPERGGVYVMSRETFYGVFDDYVLPSGDRYTKKR